MQTYIDQRKKQNRLFPRLVHLYRLEKCDRTYRQLRPAPHGGSHWATYTHSDTRQYHPPPRKYRHPLTNLTNIMAKLTDRKHIIDVIYAKQGIVTQVAKALGVSRNAIYDAGKRWASVAVALEDAKHDYDETVLDEAEIKLREAVRNGESWALKYVLSTKGKKRGYVERQEVTGKDGGDLRVRFVDYGLSNDAD